MNPVKKFRARDFSLENVMYYVADSDVTFIKVCCAFMNGLKHDKGYFVYPKGRATKGLEEHGELFATWIMSKSPWRKCFKRRSGAAYLREGYVEMNTKMPANIFVGACASFRIVTEHPSHLYMFGELVKAGVNPHFAYLVSTSFIHKGILSTSDVVYARQINHTGLHTDLMSKEEVINFCTKEKPRHTREPQCEGGRYSGYMDSTWNSKEAKTTELVEAIKSSVVKGTGTKINPFQPKPKVSEFSFNDFLNAVLKVQKEWLGVPNK